MGGYNGKDRIVFAQPRYTSVVQSRSHLCPKDLSSGLYNTSSYHSYLDNKTITTFHSTALTFGLTMAELTNSFFY